MFTSTDAGERWQKITAPSLSSLVTAIAVMPDDPAVVYAGNAAGSLFKSTDSGQTWNALTSLYLFIYSITIDPARHRLLVNGGDAAYGSADDGTTWQFIGGMPFVQGVAVVGGREYVLTNNGVWVSDDGNSFHAVASLQNGGLTAIAGVNSSVFVAGTSAGLESDDNGQTWRNLPGPQPAQVNALVALSPNQVFASSKTGVYEFDGTQWRRFGDDLATVAVIGSVPVGSGTALVAATNAGIFKSDVANATWRTVARGMGRVAANDITVVPQQPDVVVAATETGVFKSVDRGETWVETHAGRTERVAVARDATNSFFATTGTDVLRSTDAAEHWDGIKATRITSGLAVAADGQTVYAALSDGLYKSTDGGSSWFGISNGLYLGYAYFYDYFTTDPIVVDPNNSQTAYAVDAGGLYKTVNGTAWAAIPTGQPDPVVAMTVDPRAPATILAALRGGGIFRSFDSGKTWSKDDSPDRVICFAVSAADSTVYAGTSSGHVYRSLPGSRAWTPFDEGLGSSAVSALAVSASGLTLYAATADGMFEYDITDATLTAANGGASYVAQLLGQIEAGGNASAFLVPITGSGTGAFDTRFATDLIVANGLDRAQDLVITWLPANGSAATYRLTVPRASNGSFVADAINERLGVPGLGALFIAAVDSSGSLDGSAAIGGSARIWTSLDDTDETSQLIPMIGAGGIARHSSATAHAMREDDAFRTNFGIVNLESAAAGFHIQVVGERRTTDFVITVPPLSVVHAAIPAGDYGALTINASTTTPSHWALYGTTIDNTTGAATTVVGGAQ